MECYIYELLKIYTWWENIGNYIESILFEIITVHKIHFEVNESFKHCLSGITFVNDHIM